MRQPDPSDLVESSLLRPLFHLLAAFDREILALYADLDSPDAVGFRSHFAGPLIQLGRRGPLTVRQLADRAEVTHSAMSQTVAAMRRGGFVTDAPVLAGADRRARAVVATDKAARLTTFLEAEWRSTELTLRELDAELPYALSRVVADVERALADRSFRDRLRGHLASSGGDRPVDPGVARDARR